MAINHRYVVVIDEHNPGVNVYVAQIDDPQLLRMFQKIYQGENIDIFVIEHEIRDVGEGSQVNMID